MINDPLILWRAGLLFDERDMLTIDGRGPCLEAIENMRTQPVVGPGSAVSYGQRWIPIREWLTGDD